MDESDYESLPESSGPLVHMAAGAAAGMLEHTVMYPFDVVKVGRVTAAYLWQTRLQRLRPGPDARYRGLAHGLRTMLRAEGPRSLFSGMSVVASGAGPAHALYFTTYEFCKEQFSSLGASYSVAAGMPSSLLDIYFRNVCCVCNFCARLFHESR